MPGILVLGEPAGRAQARATALRVRGYAAWVATSERELGWLRDQAWVRPAYAVVEVPRDTAGLEALAEMASKASLPAVLVGAEPAQRSLFPGVVATLPATANADAIADTVRALASVGAGRS